MPIKHAKTSTIEDGVDTDLVQPSDWNADHTGSNLTVEEADGTPSVSDVVKIKVTNGSLTDDGSGVVSLAIAAGSTDVLMVQVFS
jgi:hypothetical protein